MSPSALTTLNLLLLLVIALLLFLPVLGHPVPLLLVAGLLALRLSVRVYQGYKTPALQRPVAWIMDAALLALLLWQGRQEA